MKQNLLFNQASALGKRLAMVLTMLLIVGVGQAWGAEDVSTFTSSSFAGLSSSWSETSSGTLGYEDARGVQHQKNATTTFTATGFSNVTKLQVWVAKSNKGAGSVKIQENTTAVKTISSFNTSSTEQSYTWTTPYTGTLKIVVNATASSIYIKKIVVTTAAATTYTVTYDLNGGTGTTPTQANVAAGGTFTLAASSEFSKTGYSFAGWNDGTTTYNEGAIYTMPAKAVTLTAQWTELPKYTVTLMDDESTLTQSTAGSSVTLPPRDGCDGYEFVGWTKSWNSPQTSWTTTAPTIIPDGSYTPTADVNLYPVYTKIETTEGTTTTTIDYVLTDLAHIKSTDIVVITTYHSTNGTYAMSNNNGTGSAPTATKVNVDGTKLLEDPGSNYKWNISNSSGNLTIYPNGTTSTWLYCTSTNNGVRVGTNNSKIFTIDSSSGYLKHTGTGRYLGVYSNQDWRCYTSSTVNIGGQELKFYVEKTTTTTTSTTTTYYISVPECSTETLVTLNPKGGTFASTPVGWTKVGDNYVITHTGTEITLPTNISLEGKIFGGWYKEETKYETIPANLTESITLTAKWSDKQDPEIAWEPETCTVTIDAIEEVPVEFQNPNELTDIAFESSDPTVAPVDDKGVITLGTTSTTVTVTITATFAGDATYAAKNVTCTLTVNPSNCRWVETEIGDITFGDDVLITVPGIDANGVAILNMMQDPHAATNPTIETMNVSDLLNGANVDATLIWNIRKRDDNQDNFTIYRNGSTTDRLAFITNYGVRVGGNNADSIFTLTPEKYLKSIATQEYLRMATSDWRHYSTNTTQTLKFYKRECLDSEHYWVTWDAGEGTWTDGSSNKLESYEVGATITKPADPTREGYRFDGWHNGTAVVDPATTMGTSNLTYTAQWTKVYTVTFYNNGGAYDILTDLESGATVVFPTTDPTSCDTENYPHFIGWTINPINGSTDEEPDLVTSATVSDEDLEYHAVFAAGTQGTTSTETDTLTRELIGITGTSYIDWSGKRSNSDAVYAGNSSGGGSDKTYIQLRSKESTAGIVTTTSGGKATKVDVLWNSGTTSGRTLDVYGKNSAYSAASDLYSASTQGTKLGSIVKGTSTELTIDGDYEYIGLRSNDGAMYLDEIQITWSAGSAANYTSFITSCCDATANLVLTPNPASPIALDIDGNTSTTISFATENGEEALYYRPTITPSENTSLTINGTWDNYTSSAGSYTYNFTATGTYTIKQEFKQDGYDCKKSASATINVVANPILQVSAEALEFSPTCGQNSASREVEINSRYLTSNSITAAVATTSGSGQFTISTDNSTFGTSYLTLSGGITEKVTDQIYVRYEAIESETGNVAGTLTLTCGDEEKVITLTGTCTCSANVTITGDPIQITAAKDIWVEAATELTVTGTFLTTNADNANVSIRAYTNNDAFQIKTGGTIGEGTANALTLGTNISNPDWTGNIGIVYKPTQANTTETATLTVEVYRHNGSTIYSTATYELEGRSLPEQFVIAVTNGSGDWFAVPADMIAPWGDACSGLGTFAPYPISVDNTTAPTIASDVPARAVYQAAARTGNVNTNPQTMSYKSVPLGGNYYLYGSSTNVDSDGSNTNIQNASFAASEKQKWFLDVVDWNTKQYNMHVHSSLTTNVLAYTTAGGANRVGQYSATAGTTKKSIYLLPINGTTCTYYAAPVVTVTAIDATNATIQFKNDRTTAYEISLDQNTWTDLPVTLIKDCNNSEEATQLQAQLPLATYRGQTVYIRAKVTTGTACQETGSFVVPNPTIDRGETPWEYTGTAGKAFSDNSKSITISDLWNPLSVRVVQQVTGSNIQASITPEGVVTVSMAAEDATEGVHQAILQFISDGASFVDNGKGNPQYVGVQITLHSLAEMNFDGGNGAFVKVNGMTMLCKEEIDGGITPKIYLNDALCLNGNYISTTAELNQTTFSLVDLNSGASLSFERDGTNGGTGGGIASVTFNASTIAAMIPGHTYRLSWENTNQVMTNKDGLPYMDCYMDFVYSENCDAPTALAACPITQTSFTANWAPVADCTGDVTVDVYTKQNAVLQEYNFTTSGSTAINAWSQRGPTKWFIGGTGVQSKTTNGYKMLSTDGGYNVYSPQLSNWKNDITTNDEVKITLVGYNDRTDATTYVLKLYVVEDANMPTSAGRPSTFKTVTINGQSTNVYNLTLAAGRVQSTGVFTIKGLSATDRFFITSSASAASCLFTSIKMESSAKTPVATKTISCNAGSAEFTGLSANITYYYTVTDGSSNTSNEIAVTTYSAAPTLKYYSDKECTTEITETTVLGGEETIVYVKGSNVPACDITPIISSGYGMDYSNISYTTGTGAVSGSIILTLTDANTTEGTLTITDAEGNDYVLNIVSSDCPAGFGTMALPATNITNESAQANWKTTLDFGDDKSGTLHLYKNGVVNRELIVNGDFETGSLDAGWSNGINNGVVGAAHSFDTYAIATAHTHDGNYSLLVTDDGSEMANFKYMAVMYADEVTLTPGTYRMSAWVKMLAANNQYLDKKQSFALGLIDAKNSENVVCVSDITILETDEEYHQLTYTFEITSTITACPAIGANVEEETFRDFYLDDVSLMCTSIGQSDEPYLSIDIADLSDAGNLALTDLSGNTEYTYVIQNADGCSSNPITFQTTEAGAPVITPNDVAISCQVGGSVNGIMTLTVKDVYGDIYISNSYTERIKLKTTQLPKEGGVVNFTFTPLTTDEGGTTGTCIISFTTKGMSTPAEGVITWTVTAGKDPNQPNVEVVDITNESMDIEHNQGDDNNVHIVISREKGEGEIEENLGEEIFFSKYYEAYMHKKLWAIYNPTNHPISLANTYVWRSNGKSTEWNTENGLDLSGLGNIEPGYIHPNEEIIIYTADQVGACEQSKADMSDWVAMSSSDPALSFSGNDALLLVRKDIDGDADNPPTESVELDSNGDPYELSWRRYTDAGGQQWWMLDIIGARKNDNTPDNSATYTWNWTCNGKTETGDAAGWVGTGEHLDATLYTDCPYVLSTNRCLLIRKMTVKSGYKAILNNVGDMQTLNTEWRGAHVPRSGDQEAVSCENFSFVGGYDYDSYYNAWTPIDEMDYIDAVKNDDGSYTISPINMPQYYCHLLRIEVYITENINGEDVNDVKAYIDYKVPIVVDYDTDTSDPDYFSKPTDDNELTDAICAECDVVIRNGAKLTHIEDGKAEFRTMQVYPTGRLDIPEGLTMQLEGLQMYAKNDEVGYAIINGSTIEADNIVHIKRINDMYWYPFSLPYDCKVSSIYQLNGKSMGEYWTDWGIKYYDGEARQQMGDNYVGGEKSAFWKKLEPDQTLKANQGYIIGLFTTEYSGQMKSVYFPPVESTKYSENAGSSKTTYISNWPDNLTCEPRHRGWNFTGLPYISLFSSQNGDGTTSLTMGSQADDDATSSIVYVSIPDGGDSRTYTQVSAASVKLEPFKPYFVQAMDPEDGKSHDDIALTYSKGGRTLDKIQARSAASTQATIIVELVVTNADATLTDNAGVLANDRYTENYEIAADLMKMYAEDRKPQLFTRAANNEMMAYNALPDCLAQNIPLGLFVPEAGEYTISILEDASQLADAEAAYLLYEGEIVANLLYSDYTIVASQRGLINGYSLDIRRKQNTTTNINNLTDGAPIITIVDGQIVIQQLPDNAEVQIIDVLGRVLYQQANVPDIITFQAPATGVYNVVITTTEQQFTHKTIIR